METKSGRIILRSQLNAYGLGIEAAKIGVPSTANPHVGQSEANAVAWLAGWMDTTSGKNQTGGMER